MGGSAARLNAGDDRLIGDEAAFAELYDRHAAELHAYCRHLLGSGHDVEDVLQQTFWKAYRRLRGGRKPAAFRPWLFTIARNECLTMLRRVRAERNLPGEQRDALILSGLEALSGAEIARLLQTDPARVKALVYRARRSMVASRDSRDASCAEIRAQLVTLSGGSLRRRVLREHLLICVGCRQFRGELRAATPRPPYRRVAFSAG